MCVYFHRDHDIFVTHEILRALYVNAGVIKPVSKSAIQKTYLALNQVFEVARLDRIISFNPCDGVKVPDGTEGTHRALTTEERAVITSTWQGHRFGLAAMIMLYAGLRKGEALALAWDNIHLDNGYIRIEDAVSFQKNAPITGDTKTEASVRDIPIT